MQIDERLERIDHVGRKVAASVCLIAALAMAMSATMAAQASTMAIQSDDASAQRQIGQLIEQLGDPSFIKRELAKQQLEKFGLLAFESLRAAEMHSNVEIAHSATYLLESMQVDWSLPADSFEVQSLLKGYNDRNLSSKLDALQRLSKLERIDAIMALLRLMRYEKDEKISKTAGLYVMENAILSLTDRPDEPSTSEPPVADLPWKVLISDGASESTRSTAKWLLSLSEQLDANTVAVDVWQKHVLQERMLLESNTRGRSQSRTKTDEEIVKRLYRAVAKLMLAKGQSAAALDFFEPCLDLVPKEQKEAFGDLQWMLESGLSPAVVRLNALRPDLFNRARNRYLLAEAYLQLGQTEVANSTAEQAKDLTALPAEAVRRMTPGTSGDREAVLRHQNFDYLLQRGLHDWAEGELKRILANGEQKNELSIQQELVTRQRLADFYWSADHPDQAAKVWEPIMQRAGLLDPLPPDSINKELQKELLQRNSEDVPYGRYIPSHYFFYMGLAASKSGQWEQARTHLKTALEYETTNPDLLIAMYHATKDNQEYKKLVDDAIEGLEINLRNDLEKAEGELAMARTARPTYENAVAIQCNQLAWLLSCTRRKVSDAVLLSQRACNLVPDYAVYIDTLARCHFSAGNIDKAIELQTRAIKLMPYEKSMQRQLAEFRAAKQ